MINHPSVKEIPSSYYVQKKIPIEPTSLINCERNSNLLYLDQNQNHSIIFPNNPLATKSVQDITTLSIIPPALGIPKKIIRKQSPSQYYNTINNTPPLLEVNPIEEISSPNNNEKTFMKSLQPQKARQTIHSPINRNYFDQTNKDEVHRTDKYYNNIYYNNEDLFNINSDLNNTINVASINKMNNKNILTNNNFINEISKNDKNNDNSTFNEQLNTIDYFTNNEIEPESNFNLSEFKLTGIVGEGTEGEIYSVIWKKNNKKYALKISKINNKEILRRRQEEIKMIKNFRHLTGNDGVMKTFGELCRQDQFGTYDFYEIMELAQIDWDKEISNRFHMNLFYTENELLYIMKQIIKTLSLLQKNHITHRDIKPQNIMIVNGKFKLCDFGNGRKIRKEGYLIQKVGGSEMYMSPILFKGLHSKLPHVKHNTFKSDVFSLGMCFLLAATLSYYSLNIIREIYDMNIVSKVIKDSLRNRYSHNVYNILNYMLQVDERLRPDFIQLETLFP